jgi:glutaryl-CoA dehydrogenase
MFDKVKNIMDLAKSIDFGKLEEISKKVDLGAVMDAVSKMDDKQLHGLMKMLSAGK